MRAVIGITTSIQNEELLTTSLDNIRAMTQFGAVPVALPNIEDEQAIDTLVDAIDGLLLTGGGDIDPTLFGEEPHPQLGEVSPARDRFEIFIATRCLERNIPILGICRGCQVLNVAAGGTVYQDMQAQVEQKEKLLQHAQKAPRSHASHYVTIEEKSLLYSIFHTKRMKVNSYHHQAVRELGQGMKVSATAGDGMIEAFESTQHPFALGVQWHPENMLRSNDQYSARLFKAFIKACQSKLAAS